MRILAVTPYYTPEGGGLEQYAHAILGRLAARGHEVDTLSFTRLGLADTHRDGVRVIRRLATACLGNSPLHPRFLSHVRTHIRETRPDLVVGHTPVPFPAEMGYMAARREHIPFVATYHAGTMRGSTRFLGTLAALHRATFERRMIAGSDHLIAVGPYVRDHALARERERVTIVPPGVDADFFHSTSGPEGPGILFVAPLARSYAWKGADVLWRAFAKVRDVLPNATLTLVGGGDRLDEFRSLAAPFGRAVRVLGRITETELREEYRRAAVVALPSTTDAESFGMVLAEANACRRPVVGSDIGGIPDFVRDGHNGLLARPGDATDLAAKLVDVLSDESRARDLGARGRQRVVRLHDWNDLAGQTEFAFERVLNR
ncbi:MAG: glycosyltransferase family 4 protein [Candidatus Thermoplasmatota archaeon]